MLKKRSIQSIYNNRIILEDINFTLRHREATAGIGSNAAGTAAVLNRVTGNVLPAVGVVNYSFVICQPTSHIDTATKEDIEKALETF